MTPDTPHPVDPAPLAPTSEDVFEKWFRDNYHANGQPIYGRSVKAVAKRAWEDARVDYIATVAMQETAPLGEAREAVERAIDEFHDACMEYGSDSVYGADMKQVEAKVKWKRQVLEDALSRSQESQPPAPADDDEISVMQPCTGCPGCRPTPAAAQPPAPAGDLLRAFKQAEAIDRGLDDVEVIIRDRGIANIGGGYTHGWQDCLDLWRKSFTPAPAAAQPPAGQGVDLEAIEAQNRTDTLDLFQVKQRLYMTAKGPILDARRIIGWLVEKCETLIAEVRRLRALAAPSSPAPRPMKLTATLHPHKAPDWKLICICDSSKPGNPSTYLTNPIYEDHAKEIAYRINSFEPPEPEAPPTPEAQS